MLVVASAVGVASCFGAPVSGEGASKGLALIWVALFHLLSIWAPLLLMHLHL